MRVGLYLHFPFCVSRCTYCDFNAYTSDGQSGPDSMQERYLEALIADIHETGKQQRYTIHTVFCGGGTPSLYSPQQIDRVFQACREAFNWKPVEVTIEANPGTVTAESLQGYHDIGIHRISLGVQALQERLLQSLNRIHSPADVSQAVQWARQAGYKNLSLDLIYGLPGQQLQDWDDTLDLVLSLEPEHFSIYQLIVEPGTRLESQIKTREIHLPPEGRMLRMDSVGRQRMRQAGYRPYEISNWTKPGFHSRHNRIYWQDRPYLGLGCGATGFVNGWRIRRILHPEIYARVLNKGGSPISSCEKMGFQNALRDCLMMGLRTCWGVSFRRLTHRFPEFNLAKLRYALSELPDNWFEWKQEDAQPIALRLTRKGADFATTVQHALMESIL